MQGILCILYIITIVFITSHHIPLRCNSSLSYPTLFGISLLQMSKMSSANPSYDAQASTNYREAFQLFDKRGTQRVQLDQLGDLLRACGQNPTLNEIRELEKNVGGECEFIVFLVMSRVRGWFSRCWCAANYYGGAQNAMRFLNIIQRKICTNITFS